MTYKSFDGTMISAYMWVPFNLKRDGTAAAVVMPHGGPTGQVVDNFNSRAVLLASRGFVVIAPNVRGSTGYGKVFQDANKKDLGGGDLIVDGARGGVGDRLGPHRDARRPGVTRAPAPPGGSRWPAASRTRLRINRSRP